jgi:hypothetical protein
MSEKFLKDLRQHLKSFPVDERGLILEEIRSHIDCAGQDGNASAGLGSAEQMGQEFQKVYRPNRWRDLLLVIIPVYVIFPLLIPLLMIIYKETASVLYMEIRLVIFTGLLCALIGKFKHSILLRAYWVPVVCCMLIALILRESRWNLMSGISGQTMIENITWFLLLAALLAWTVRILWKNRGDWLISTFILLPFMTAIFNYGGLMLLFSTGAKTQLIDWNIAGIQLLPLLDIVYLACFFLLPGRNLRWLALFINQAFQTAAKALTMRSFPPLIALWCLLAGAVLIFWLVDRKTKTHLPSA